MGQVYGGARCSCRQVPSPADPCKPPYVVDHTDVYGYIPRRQIRCILSRCDASAGLRGGIFSYPRDFSCLRNAAPEGAHESAVNALILAAGRGRRLWPYTSERPKCLLSLGVHSILEHQLLRLAAVGIDHVTVVAGFGLDAVRAEVCRVEVGDMAVRVVYNPFFALADNLISLWAARAEMGSDFLLLNGDNVFHPDIPRLLLEPHPVACRLLVQRQPSYSEDDMKVHLDGGDLLRIGKKLCLRQADAASIGMMRFMGDGAAALQQVLEEAIRSEEAFGRFYLDCVQRLVEIGVPVACQDIGNLPWADIDTPQDLQSVVLSRQRFEREPGQMSERERA